MLLPPYAPRLERPMAPAAGDAGEVVAFERDPKKKAHDVAVFGTDYF